MDRLRMAEVKTKPEAPRPLPGSRRPAAARARAAGTGARPRTAPAGPRSAPSRAGRAERSEPAKRAPLTGSRGAASRDERLVGTSAGAEARHGARRVQFSSACRVAASWREPGRSVAAREAVHAPTWSETAEDRVAHGTGVAGAGAGQAGWALCRPAGPIQR